jgi:hypothetical protein
MITYPLGEDDCLITSTLGGLENLDERFELGAASTKIDRVIPSLITKVIGWLYKDRVVLELCTTHWTLLLCFDDTFNTLSAKDVSTRCNNRIVQVVKADSTFFLGLNAQR